MEQSRLERLVIIWYCCCFCRYNIRTLNSSLSTFTELTINNVAREDTNTRYVCYSSNQHGRSQSSAWLYVQGNTNCVIPQLLWWTYIPYTNLCNEMKDVVPCAFVCVYIIYLHTERESIKTIYQSFHQQESKCHSFTLCVITTHIKS